MQPSQKNRNEKYLEKLVLQLIANLNVNVYYIVDPTLDSPLAIL